MKLRLKITLGEVVRPDNRSSKEKKEPILLRTVKVIAISISLVSAAGCGSSQNELEKTVLFHDALFPGIGDVKTLRVSDLSASNTTTAEMICGTAFYDLESGKRQSPSRFLMYVSPIKSVVMENDYLAGHNTAFASTWTKICEG